MPKTKVPKPAQIVKCPYCDPTGSARGLFTHTRLAHPNSPLIETKAANPYSINKSYSSVGTNRTLIKKKKKVNSNPDWGTTLTIAILSLIAQVLNENKITIPPTTLLREADKPKRTVAIGKI